MTTITAHPTVAHGRDTGFWHRLGERVMASRMHQANRAVAAYLLAR